LKASTNVHMSVITPLDPIYMAVRMDFVYSMMDELAKVRLYI